MGWFEFKLKTTSEVVEAVMGIYYDFDVSGIEVIDPKDPIFSSGYEGDWDYFDKDELTFEYDGAMVKAYFETETPDELLKSLKTRVDGLKEFGFDPSPATFEYTEVFEKDYIDEWKKYYKPTKIGKRIVIKPSWEEYNTKDDEVIIEIDPGGAFGSGTHETTRMCVEFLDEYVKEDSRVFDIGCGSGILGIAAAKLGAREVIGGDIDENAVVTSIDNVERNNVTDTMVVKQGDLMEVVEGTADIIVANIIADIIMMLTPSISKFMHKDTIFISSGIINVKLAGVLETFEANGFEIVEVNQQGEWSAVACKLKV